MRVRVARPEDLGPLIELEQASYPDDEAASLAMFEYRIKNAADCFLVGEDERGRIVAFVCGTRSTGLTLEHESMLIHDASGETLCIHSVVVAAQQRRRGLALELLAAYRAHGSALSGVIRLALICKEPLISLYRKAGFALVGPSPVVHGRESWFEMRTAL